MQNYSTILECFWNSPDIGTFRNPADNWQRLEAMDSQKIRQFVLDLTFGLINAGLEKGDRIAIWAPNCILWFMMDMAALSAGGIVVPIHQTTTQEGAQKQTAHAQCKMLVTIGTNIQAIQEFKKIGIEKIILLDSTYLVFTADPSCVTLGTLITDACLRYPGTHIENHLTYMSTLPLVSDYDPATIIYTSGTTGEGKGCVHTHGDIAKNLKMIGLLNLVQKNERYVSFLPLSHIFERWVQWFLFLSGAYIYHCDKTTPANLMEAFQLHQPTLICTVPSLLEKIHAGKGLSPIKRTLLGLAFRAYRKNWPTIFKNILDRTVIQTIKKKLGGSVRTLLVGGAPIRTEIIKDFNAIGLDSRVGFGMSEAGVITLDSDGTNPGAAGKPLSGVEIKIIPTDEWPQTHKNPYIEGEILVKSPGLMKEYYRNPEATGKILQDNWLATGDIGYLDNKGILRIIGRVKDMIVLGNGEKVFPLPIEEKILQYPEIQQVCIIGNSRNFVKALIVPQNQHTRKEDFDNILQKVNSRLEKWEKIYEFEIIPEPFTIEAGLLTPTLKLRRNAISLRYGSTL
ncbi:MAG: long-chain acyl-CoA synthetase [Parcubacteria group bacterium Gr01-1014_18]|nr:MAG: long-chain acyl-CoA synthetase [Parcubacteria group bacterium Greene0416_36]TSC81271.1 MAG: long-chain acyl-CoA synthetase [Parcubacteria group bacterium Gr01-1014_18]TSC99293.1 MAG: long-chain acyl-CoA synthetase [Parcubacteria group bacterium Greene1014_20]TSD06870.1 MAG: long-chain acyl-CoA synthetase [Parcubacteria group bacterium Greene0714_2]